MCDGVVGDAECVVFFEDAPLGGLVDVLVGGLVVFAVGVLVGVVEDDVGGSGFVASADVDGGCVGLYDNGDAVEGA